MRRCGADVGGTFTDLIYVDDDSGVIHVTKLESTPDDPSRATLDGVEAIAKQAGTTPAALDHMIHGTTVATNIVIEHSGASVGLLTTDGFRDILHIARHKKPLSFSNYQELPWQRHPIVRRRHRLTIGERIAADGEVLVPLDLEEARARVEELKAQGVEAVAICFLFSFLNPEHERQVAAIVNEEFPDAFLSVSSEVLPQYREYERFSSVCLNAYVGPKVSTYVQRLREGLTGLGVQSTLHLMTSGSGVVTADQAIARPVDLLVSGPVAGVVGGIWAGRQAGFDSVITLDVGGTSADVGVAERGELRMRHLLDAQVGGYDVMTPMVDVDAIGAGGGSIVYVDAGGIFRVGPRSAGADPGPAAYGRGGTEPTITDALVNLGWLLPDEFLGGARRLLEDNARSAFEPVCRELDASVEEASYGAVEIAIHSMVQSIEQNSVRKGFDPRDFALVAAGGAGPVFAALIASEVRTQAVVIPQYPGIVAAMGLVATDMLHEYAATVYETVSRLDAAGLQDRFAQLEASASARLEADGIPEENRIVERIADCRYQGQGYELRIPCPPGAIDEEWVASVVAAFHDAHEREYSRRFADSDLEIPNIRVRAIGLTPGFPAAPLESGDETPPSEAVTSSGDAWFKVDGNLEALPTTFCRRELLRAGNLLHGPTIVNQADSTTVVPPGTTAQVHTSGSLILMTADRVAGASRGASVLVAGGD